MACLSSRHILVSGDVAAGGERRKVVGGGVWRRGYGEALYEDREGRGREGVDRGRDMGWIG